MAYREDRNGIIRDQAGRFVKGQSGNPNGKPKKIAEQQAEYLTALYEELPLDQWRATVQLWRDKAKTDFEVFRYLDQKLSGMARQVIDLDVETRPVIELEFPAVIEPPVPLPLIDDGEPDDVA